MKEDATSIFKTEEQTEQEASMKHAASRMESTSFSTSVEFQRTARRSVAEDRILHDDRCENPRFHIFWYITNNQNMLYLFRFF
jgi:hypothetical protein